MISGTDCTETNGDEFSDELSRLKRQGTSVLVVGSVQPDQRQDTCQRLLGCGADRLRRRILVSTTGESHPVSHFVDDTSSERLSVITYDTQARSAAATAPAASPSIDPSTTDVDTLADLGIAISSAVESFEADADVLEPAEVRVGIDSLLPLLEEYGKQRVFKFLHLINGRTRSVNGMAHYHLPVERDAQIVPILSPLFDVIIELREQNGECQERWVIDDGAYSSGWLTIDPE
ncbi:hypothetical protein HYG81_11750 [Natrinema zhouii]|uniref:Uncharacterized protein n=1 Tax=Natrinema zhouii TaxID=1710539 RepID=A0A7D6GY91_9EURY|nr:hypothetical protein [Natrinema zhouii]QLK24785.1 hypothetical protein HYG81_11750 [Natrinema zhouii]